MTKALREKEIMYRITRECVYVGMLETYIHKAVILDEEFNNTK